MLGAKERAANVPAATLRQCEHPAHSWMQPGSERRDVRSRKTVFENALPATVGPLPRQGVEAAYMSKACNAAALERLPGTADVILPPNLSSLIPNFISAIHRDPWTTFEVLPGASRESAIYSPHSPASLICVQSAIRASKSARLLSRCCRDTPCAWSKPLAFAAEKAFHLDANTPCRTSVIAVRLSHREHILAPRSSRFPINARRMPLEPKLFMT